MDYLFCPCQGHGIFVMGLSEGVYGAACIQDGVGAQVTERLPLQDAKPAFHLIRPGSVRGGVVETQIAVLGQPQLMFGFMGVQVIDDNVQFSVSGRDDDVHENEGLPTTTDVMAGSH